MHLKVKNCYSTLDRVEHTFLTSIFNLTGKNKKTKTTIWKIDGFSWHHIQNLQSLINYGPKQNNCFDPNKGILIH